MPQQHFGGAITTVDLRAPGASDREVLAATAIGAGLDPGELDALLAAGSLRLIRAEADEVVALRAEPQTEFFVVLTGRLEVVRTRTDGSRHIIDLVSTGRVCGAVTALGERPRWPADVRSPAASRLLAINTAWLLADGAPLLARQWLLKHSLLLLAERAQHLNARAELLSRRGLRARLAFFLVRHADANGDVRPGMTRQELADHLQVSRASMTRELGRMADAGLLSINGRRFTLHDRPALRRLAE